MSELANRQLAIRWFEYAKDDLQAALVILANSGVAPRTACFLAQQSAEKALKAISVLKGMHAIRTHDLDALSESLPKTEHVRFEDFDLAWLTEWSVESRYPGDWQEASREDAKKAVTIATEVINTCNDIIMSES